MEEKELIGTEGGETSIYHSICTSRVFTEFSMGSIIGLPLGHI